MLDGFCVAPIILPTQTFEQPPKYYTIDTPKIPIKLYLALILIKDTFPISIDPYANARMHVRMNVERVCDR